MSDKKKEALEAIDELFGDTSVSLRKTLEMLEEVRDEVEGKIEAIREDIKAGRG